VREIRLVFETDPGNFARSDTHIMDRITWALAQVQNVNIGVAFFDENGNRIPRSSSTSLPQRWRRSWRPSSQRQNQIRE